MGPAPPRRAPRSGRSKLVVLCVAAATLLGFLGALRGAPSLVAHRPTEQRAVGEGTSDSPPPTGALPTARSMARPSALAVREGAEGGVRVQRRRPEDPSAHLLLVNSDEESMCVCIDTVAYPHTLRRIEQEGRMPPPPLPLLWRRSLDPVARLTLPSGLLLEPSGFGVEAANFSSGAALLDAQRRAPPNDVAVAELSLMTQSCSGAGLPASNGTFRMCFASRAFQDPVRYDGYWAAEQLRRVLRLQLDRCPEYLEASTAVVDIAELRRDPEAWQAPPRTPCFCPEAPDGRGMFADQRGTGTNAFWGPAEAVRVDRRFARDFPALLAAAEAAEAAPLSTKDEHVRNAAARRKQHAKTALVCDPHARQPRVAACAARAMGDAVGLPVASLRIVHLQRVDAPLACYMTDDLVCSTLHREREWETHLEDILLRSLQGLSRLVAHAQTRLRRVLDPEGARAVPHQRASPIEFIDIGANVGAFAVSMWKRGFPVRAFEALPSNAFLLRTSRCLSEQPELPPFTIDHVALSEQPLASEANATAAQFCGLFSEDENRGDAHLVCDPTKAMSETLGTLRRRAIVPLATLDDVMLGPGAELHRSPAGASEPHLLAVPPSPPAYSHEAALPPSNRRGMRRVFVPVQFRDIPVEQLSVLTQRWRAALDAGRPVFVASKAADPLAGRVLMPFFKDGDELQVVFHEAPDEVDRNGMPVLPFADARYPLGVNSPDESDIAALQDVLRWKQYVIKIDVETHELAVMRGGFRFLGSAAAAAGSSGNRWRPRVILSEVLSSMNASGYLHLMVGTHGYLAYSIARQVWLLDTHAALRHARWLATQSSKRGGNLFMDNVVFVDRAVRAYALEWVPDCFDSESLHKRALAYLANITRS